MKFYSMDQWIADQNLDDPDLVERVTRSHTDYQTNIARIRERFPSDLSTFVDTVNLQDGTLQRFTVDCGEATASAQFDASNPEMKRDFLVALTYLGVTYATTTSLKDGFEACGYGDILFDKLYLDEKGLFVHGILFSIGVELEVHFADCRPNLVERS